MPTLDEYQINNIYRPVTKSKANICQRFAVLPNSYNAFVSNLTNEVLQQQMVLPKDLQHQHVLNRKALKVIEDLQWNFLTESEARGETGSATTDGEQLLPCTSDEHEAA